MQVRIHQEGYLRGVHEDWTTSSTQGDLPVAPGSSYPGDPRSGPTTKGPREVENRKETEVDVGESEDTTDGKEDWNWPSNF